MVETSSLSIFRVVIMRIGRETELYEMVVLHDMGPTIPRDMIDHVHIARAIVHNHLSI